MFWRGIWDKDASYNDKAMWIAGLKTYYQASVIQQKPMTISENDLRPRVIQMKKWTAPRPDMIHT